MKDFKVVQIPAMEDNYFYLIHDRVSGKTAAIDPGQSAPIEQVLAAKGWKLDLILLTHHHLDHVGGVVDLKKVHRCEVVGSEFDKKRLPFIDRALREGDEVHLGEAIARVLDVPGHTLGHIAYYFEANEALFCGDTLFALGCGRLFEGTAEMLWKSLQKIAALPPETLIFCAHEYTAANARFALSIDDHNSALLERAREVESLRKQGRPTVPSSLGEELLTNPFLRVEEGAFRKSLQMEGKSSAEAFAEVRRWKDHFHG